MKKTISLLVLLCLCVASVFAFTNESEYSYTYVPLSKVYNCSEGYVAMYTLDGYNVSTTYLPVKWFMFGDTRGKLINLPHDLLPYMTIVYKNGEFQYVTLAVPRDPSDSFWGVLSPNVNVDGKFNIEQPVVPVFSKN